MKTLLLFLVAILPGIIWLFIFLRYDKKNPEPKKKIVTFFIAGIGVTLLVIIAEFATNYLFFGNTPTLTTMQLIISSLIIVAPIEEIAKYLTYKGLSSGNSDDNQPIDPVMYLIAIGLGFATIENIFVVFTEGELIVAVRAVTTTLMHALAAGIIGYHISLNKLKPKKYKGYVAQGIMVAIVFHGLHNIVIVLTNNIGTIMLILSLLLTIMYAILHMGIKELKKCQIDTQS